MIKHNKHWTNEELTILRQMYPDHHHNDISKVIPKTPLAIMAKAQRIGLTKSADYISKSNTKARALNTKVSIRKYNCNDNYFEVIDTEDKAYFLGWMWSDGYIRSSHQQMGLGLSARDKEILYTFAQYLEADNKIYITSRVGYTTSDVALLVISSTKLVSDLVDKGITAKKTHDGLVPLGIPDALIRHFIRGFFDGDGSVSGKTRTYTSIKFAASLEVCLWLKAILGVGSVTRKANSKVCYSYDINGARQVQKIFEYMYQDAQPDLRLHRKYDKFVSLGYTLR